MTQLAEDCFAFGAKSVTVAEALDVLRARVTAVAEIESVPLARGRGRILAEDVVSARAVPPHDNSAVDGYAFHFDDLVPDTETRLSLAGRAAAGHPLGRATRRGEAIRIFTGAAMPQGEAGGPDTVVMQENARAESGAVVIPHGLMRGANRRRAGEDVAAGTVILRAGARLRPQDLGLAASIGRTGLSVRRKLRIAIFSTGDELREPGGEAPPGTLYDANRFTLSALVEGTGARVTDLGILPDDQGAIRAALAEAAQGHDAVATSGGMSTGEEDYVRGAVESLGRFHFWRLAIKPGRPVGLGQIGRVPFIGLPGNPVAMAVTFLMLARPLLLGLAGARATEPRRYRVRAGFGHAKRPGRREWLGVRLEDGADGVPIARKFPRAGAGILSSLVAADGLVELAEPVEALDEGALVDYLPFSEVDR